MATMQSARFVEPTSMAQLEDLFCEWKSTKSHRPDVLNYFQEVFKSKQFANVTISANDGFGGVQEILAHGCVLKHGSDFFASSLSGRWGDDLKVDLTSYEFNAAQINSLIAVGEIRRRRTLVRLTQIHYNKGYRLFVLFAIISIFTPEVLHCIAKTYLSCTS